MTPTQFKNFEKQLAEVDAFILTSAYGSYLSTIKQNIAALEDNILMVSPINEADRITCLQLHASRDAQRAMLNFFEDSRTTLKTAIDTYLEAELQQPDNSKQNNNESL